MRGTLQMDVPNKLAVRFHYKGEFFYDGMEVRYSGDYEAMSYIERGKMSLHELFGHLKDHCTVEEGMFLHWLFPNKELSDGLMILSDDKACQYMLDSITEGGVADVFVESFQYSETSEDKAVQDDATSAFRDVLEVIDVDNVDYDAGQVLGTKESSITQISPQYNCKDLTSFKKFCGQQVPNSKHSATSSQKRKTNATCSITPTPESTTKKHYSGVLYDDKSPTTISHHGFTKETTIKTTALDRISTISSGSTTVNLESHVPSLEASSSGTINVTSVIRSTQATGLIPRRQKLEPRRRRNLPLLLWSPKK